VYEEEEINGSAKLCLITKGVFNNVVSQNFFTLIIFLLTIYQNHKKK
jgi:hypothetical protein